MSFISTKLSLSFEINKHHEGKIHIEQLLRASASRETKTHHHDGGPGRGKLTLRLLEGRALHIANSLTLPFYLFTFQHSEGLQMGHQMARHILHTVAATEVDT